MSDTDQPPSLTSADIAALKLADSVCFYHYPPVDGGNVIRASIREGYTEGPVIWTARQQRLYPEIERAERQRTVVVDSRMGGYAAGDESRWEGRDYPDAHGFHSITAPQLDRDWQTICKLLRPGDRLALKWQADNNTATARDHDLHVDELRLEIVRGDDPRAEVRLSFLLEVNCRLDASARMIRRGQLKGYQRR